MDGTSHPATVALSAVIVDAANLLRVPLREIAVEFLEARDWPDACLGLAQDGEGCADVITPGFIVFLGDGFRYRTDTKGNVRRETDTVDTELHVHFRQVGGIGGWSSEYYGDDASLTPADAARIRRFIESADFFHLPPEVGNGEPISDLYRYTIFLAHGRRNRTVSTYDGSGPHESPSLAEFIAWLKERAPEPGPIPPGSRG
jgi:hypothetical protein